MRKVTYYEYLKLPENATGEQIKKAYRKMAAKYHPDKNAGDPRCLEIMKTLNAVYDTLSKRRAQYDAGLAEMRRRQQAVEFRVVFSYQNGFGFSGGTGSSTASSYFNQTKGGSSGKRNKTL